MWNTCKGKQIRSVSPIGPHRLWLVWLSPHKGRSKRPQMYAQMWAMCHLISIIPIPPLIYSHSQLNDNCCNSSTIRDPSCFLPTAGKTWPYTPTWRRSLHVYRWYFTTHSTPFRGVCFTVKLLCLVPKSTLSTRYKTGRFQHTVSAKEWGDLHRRL